MTWLTKLFYLKRLSLNQELALDSKDIKEIKAIIDLMKKHDLSVFEIEKEGFRLKLQRGASASQSTTAAPAAAGGPAKGAVAGAEPPRCRESDRKRSDERDRFADGGYILPRCIARRARFC